MRWNSDSIGGYEKLKAKNEKLPSVCVSQANLGKAKRGFDFGYRCIGVGPVPFKRIKRWSSACSLMMVADVVTGVAELATIEW